MIYQQIELLFLPCWGKFRPICDLLKQLRVQVAFQNFRIIVTVDNIVRIVSLTLALGSALTIHLRSALPPGPEQTVRSAEEISGGSKTKIIRLRNAPKFYDLIFPMFTAVHFKSLGFYQNQQFALGDLQLTGGEQLFLKAKSLLVAQFVNLKIRMLLNLG